MAKSPIVEVRYRKTSSVCEEVIGSANRYLSTDERERRDRLRLMTDRRDFALAHDLLLGGHPNPAIEGQFKTGHREKA